MPYDPFVRGLFPVGVLTSSLTDSSRDRTLPFEVWYPATDDNAGRDLEDPTRDRFQVLPIAPETAQDAVRGASARDGRFPLVMFSHGFGGHRRQTTHFCTHLASHGYVVASPDHVGNTMVDVMQLFTAAQGGGGAPDDPLAMFQSFAENRPADISFGIDQLLAGAACVESSSIDGDRIGMTGHSFGGWTTLAVTGRDQAYTYLQGLGLAHMDAHLKSIPSAAELLAGDLQALLAERGVAVKQV